MLAGALFQQKFSLLCEKKLEKLDKNMEQQLAGQEEWGGLI